MDVCWPYFDPEFENLSERINGPSCRVSIDNERCKSCTVVKVDIVDKQGLLLQVVQALTDMNLTISKGYISSDAGWFMDGSLFLKQISFFIDTHTHIAAFYTVAVFHVKNEQGKKLTDQRVINNIQPAIDAMRELQDSGKVKTPAAAKLLGAEISNEHTAIELTGMNRPGLFSEISAALTELRCNIVEAHAWSHKQRLACVAYISDESTLSCIEPHRLATIKDHLSTVINASSEAEADADGRVGTAGLPGGGDGTSSTNVERRLHQLMTNFDDEPQEGGNKTLLVSIESCRDKGYSVVNIECKDRQRLLFDTVCTFTDMQYVVFHASVRSQGDFAFQEYYIRHINGCTLKTNTEKQRVIKCLEAAIERRVCEGVRLELCAHNRVGLLSDITRLLRENGLAVVRADVATQGDKAVNAFYVRDISGNEVNMEAVESMKREMKPLALKVNTSPPHKSPFSFTDMLKSRIGPFSHN